MRILEKMHNMLLLHRDIKPENIFLTGMGKFKIGDFGLAIRFDKELAFSRSGTLDYMVRVCVRASCWRLLGQFNVAICAASQHFVYDVCLSKCAHCAN